MPPGALKKYLQFPKPPEEDDAESQNTEAQAFQRAHALAALNPSRFTVPDDKRSAAAQQPPAVTAMPSPSMAQPNGVPAPAPGGMRRNSMDDEIQTQMNAYKTTMDQRPARPTGNVPQMGQLPQRPQASPWEAIPQILAGAGNVLSAGSNHPQDYLTPLMAGQKAKRDEVYGDQLAQIHNNFQNELSSYTDKTQKYSMDLRDHEQRLHDLKGHIEMLTEQKFLQGQKTPEDTAYQAQLDWARTLYKDTQNPQDIKNLAEKLSTQYPEKAKALQEAAQEAMGVNQVGFDQTKAGIKRAAGMISPTAEFQQGVENMTVPSGQGWLGRAPVAGAPRGYRALAAIPGGAFLTSGLDALEAAGVADFSGGPKHGGAPVHLPAMTEAEQKKYMEEKGKKKSSLKKQMEEQQAAQYQQRFQIPPGY